MIITIPPARLKPNGIVKTRRRIRRQRERGTAAAISSLEGDGRLGASLLPFPLQRFFRFFSSLSLPLLSVSHCDRDRVVIKYRFVPHVSCRHEAIRPRVSIHDYRRRTVDALLSLLITQLRCRDADVTLFSLLLILLIIDYYYCV